MKNITRKELLTVGLFAVFVFITATTITFGQNYKLGPISAVSRYVTRTLSATIYSFATPVSPTEAPLTAVKTTTVAKDTSAVPSTTALTPNCADGIDNDMDGDADTNDYSCANGKTEDSFESGLSTQEVAVMWPTTPRFNTRQGCFNYCKAVFNACDEPLRKEQRRKLEACNINSENNCDINSLYGCARFEPPRTPGCNRDKCKSCTTPVNNEYNPKRAVCASDHTACTNACRILFPLQTAPVTTTN